MRRSSVILLAVFCLLAGSLSAQTNVAQGKPVLLRGEHFFVGPGGWPSPPETVVDGIFLPPGTPWDQGPVWWTLFDCGGPEGPCFIEIDLEGDYLIDSFVFQGDSDTYFLEYWDIGAGGWRMAWMVGPPEPPDDVQTRPDPADNSQRHVLPEPIVTNSLRVIASPPHWDDPFFFSTDDLYGVSEIQAFGEPYIPPPPMNGKDIFTQGYFHLRTGWVYMCGEEVCAEPPNLNIAGNLFTFTHQDFSRAGRVTEWRVEKVNNSVAKGTMTIEKSCFSCFQGGPIQGEIFVEFNVRTEPVPPLEEGEPEHINFHGPFHIVGGSGSYSGIGGNGTMNGTVHAHFHPSFPPGAIWYLDFVMVGKAEFKKR
jgi:hypothetical protein